MATKEVQNRIKHLANLGIFGGQLLELENDSGEGKGAQFMSEIMFFRLTLLNDGAEEVKTIFVKIQLNDIEKITYFSTSLQFANEVAMYGTILPEMGATEFGPKMLYGNATFGKVEEDIIITEDLRQSGYKIAEDQFLDKEHVMLTMRRLGKYHGHSLKFKSEFPQRFSDFGSMLRSRKFSFRDGFLEGALYRGFASMADIPVAVKAHEKLHDMLLKKNANSLISPEEPFAVITHGDFSKNNQLYCYDDNGKVVDVKFIDFANSLLSDPVADMSFFLYLNTADDLRREHWHNFLDAYWEGLTSIVQPEFSYEQFLKHFAKKAIFGYIPCCFFLPMMMFPELAEEKDRERPREEKRRTGMTSGGDEATAAVTKITRHLLDMGYLKEFADNC